MTERKTVPKYISAYWEYSSLKDIKLSIESFIQQYGENSQLQIVEEYGNPALYVVAQVLETDEEMANRIKMEGDQKAAREKYEKQELAKLIKKYGNPSAGTNKE